MALFPFQALPYELQLKIARYALADESPLFITAALPLTSTAGAQLSSIPACLQRSSPQGHYESLDLTLTGSAQCDISSDRPLKTAADERAAARLCRSFYDAVRFFSYQDRAFDFASRYALRLFAQRHGAARAALVSDIGFALTANPKGPFLYPKLAAHFPGIEHLRLAVPGHLRNRRAEIAAEIETMVRECSRLRSIQVVHEPCFGPNNVGWAHDLVEHANQWLERRWQRGQRRDGAEIGKIAIGVELESMWSPGIFEQGGAEEDPNDFREPTDDDAANDIANADPMLLQTFGLVGNEGNLLPDASAAVLDSMGGSPAVPDPFTRQSPKLDANVPTPDEEEERDDDQGAARTNTLASEPTYDLAFDTSAGGTTDTPSLPEALRARLDRTPPLMGSPSADSRCYCSTPSSSATPSVVSGGRCWGNCAKGRPSPAVGLESRRSCGR